MRRIGIFTLFVCALVGSSVAGAAPVSEFRPSFTVAGGADDNLLFNGQGGDGVGRLTLRGRYRVRDHLWNATVDGSASLYTFMQRDRRVPLGELNATWNYRVSPLDALRARMRVRGSDDPLALAQVGLLGGSGAALAFRSGFEYEHLFSERWSVGSEVNLRGIQYFEAGLATRSGQSAGLLSKPRFRLTRDLALQTAVEGRVFFGQGLIGNAIGVMPGARWRIARRMFLEVEAGANVFTDDTGSVAVPTARSVLAWDGRQAGLRVTASQDLTIPNGRAGVLQTQLVEGMFRYGLRDWEFVGRAGYYRSLSSPRSNLWTPGYGIEGGAFYNLTPFLWMGVTALRFERVATDFQPSMSRNAIYLRFDFTRGRP